MSDRPPLWFVGVAALMLGCLWLTWRRAAVQEARAESYRDELYRLLVKHEGYRHINGCPLPVLPSTMPPMPPKKYRDIAGEREQHQAPLLYGIVGRRSTGLQMLGQAKIFYRSQERKP